jgi:histidyl-tRNA synthetase
MSDLRNLGRLKGMDDLLPAETVVWQHLESTFQRVTQRFGYGEIRTPIVEEYRLFDRTSGETSDIVSKEMYVFETRGDTEDDRVKVALRPELTAPAMRAIKQHKLASQQGTLLRFWYRGPFFRYNEPQKGRRRQGHQLGVELVGSGSPQADIEVMEVAYHFMRELGLTEHPIVINSIGRQSCRQAYGEAILSHIAAYLADSPTEEQARAAKNPLRLLDTKEDRVKAALVGVPSILDFLESDSRVRFDEIQAGLTDAGVPYTVDPTIVRGLDYYTETVFEVIGKHLGSQSSLLGGGRYDGLLESVGGPAQPAVGLGIGIERMALELAGEHLSVAEPIPIAFFVHFSAAERPTTVRLARELRSNGLAVQFDIDGRSSKSQMRQAGNSGAKYMVILGSDELERQVATVKRLADAEQTLVPFSELEAWLRAA